MVRVAQGVFRQANADQFAWPGLRYGETSWHPQETSSRMQASQSVSGSAASEAGKRTKRWSARAGMRVSRRIETFTEVRACAGSGAKGPGA